MSKSATERLLKKIKRDSRVPELKTPIATNMFLPNLSGDHSAGIVKTTPTADEDIVNKAYVDAQIAGVTPHARQHSITQTLDHTSTATAGQMMKADANGLPVNATNTDVQVAAAVTHSTNNSQAHTDYLLNTGDTATGNYNFDSGTLFIDATNDRVGIGTASPGAKLEVVSGSGEMAKFIGNNGNNYIVLSDNSATNTATLGSISGGNLYGYTSGYISLYAGGAEKVRVASDGKVGIGTASPDETLHVAGTSYFTSSMGIGTAEDATNSRLKISFSDTQGGGGDKAALVLGGAYGGAITMNDGATATTWLQDSGATWNFGMGASGAARTTIMTLKNSGNVGIGTASPSNTLAVNGGLDLTGAGTVGSANGLHSFFNTNIGYIQSLENGVAWRTLKIDGSPLLLVPDSGGKVGIGTASPGKKLDVRGDAVFNEDGGDYDFRVEGDTKPNLFFCDAGSDKVSVDGDFFVDTNTFYVNANNNYVSVGTATADAPLEVETATDLGRQAVTIDQNDDDQAFIDFQGKSDGTVNNNITTRTSASLAGFIRVEINGSTYWMPFFSNPT
jgi:hypothetical protein